MPAESIRFENLSSLKAGLRQMLAANRLESAFDILEQALASESTLREQIVTQQSRYHRTQDDRREGLVEKGYAETVFNNIVRTLDTLTKEVAPEDLRQDVFPLEWKAQAAEQAQGQPALSDLEREGLQQQEELLQRKLNSLKQAQITAYDASQKFALEEQIGDLETQLSEIRRKLQQ